MGEQWGTIAERWLNNRGIKKGGGYMNKLSERKYIRLENYDYTQVGYYYVTIYAQDRKNCLVK